MLLLMRSNGSNKSLCSRRKQNQKLRTINVATSLISFTSSHPICIYMLIICFMVDDHKLNKILYKHYYEYI